MTCDQWCDVHSGIHEQTAAESVEASATFRAGSTPARSRRDRRPETAMSSCRKWFAEMDEELAFGTTLILMVPAVALRR